MPTSSVPATPRGATSSPQPQVSTPRGSSGSSIPTKSPPLLPSSSSQSNYTTQSPNLSAPALRLEQLFFRVKQCNAHTVFNKWSNCDETAHFALQAKEKKAITSAQCRIIVKGAKHFPLQISDGPSTEHLYTTWQYCRQIEEVIPKDLPYKDVEKWVQLHIRELVDAHQAIRGEDEDDEDLEELEEDYDGDSATMGDSAAPTPRQHTLSAIDVQVNKDDQDSKSMITPLPPAATEIKKDSGSPTATTDGAGTSFGNSKLQGAASLLHHTEGPNEKTLTWRETLHLLHSSMFMVTRRPTTKEEWAKRHELMALARRNRTIATMVFFTIYTYLMRVMSFDGYLLLLFLLHIFLFYVTTFYREIAFFFARRTAEKRVNRVKDWFYFGLRGNDERKQE